MWRTAEGFTNFNKSFSIMSPGNWHTATVKTSTVSLSGHFLHIGYPCTLKEISMYLETAVGQQCTFLWGRHLNVSISVAAPTLHKQSRKKAYDRRFLTIKNLVGQSHQVPRDALKLGKMRSKWKCQSTKQLEYISDKRKGRGRKFSRTSTRVNCTGYNTSWEVCEKRCLNGAMNVVQWRTKLANGTQTHVKRDHC